MKKLLTILAAVMLCVCCFAMVGCGVEGEYSFYSMEIDGQTYKVGDTYMGVEITEESVAMYKLEIKEEGKAKYMGMDCTWEEKDGKLVISYETISVAEFEIKGSKLVVEDDGMVLTLKK